MPDDLIYIIEDEVITAKDIEGYLESLGYIVVGTASEAEKALKDIEKLRPDLVLMDIALSGKMSGTEAATIIRHRYDIPVIYITASSDELTISEAKLTEPYGYIIKPIDQRELYSAIIIAIHKNRIERRLRQSEHKFRSVVELANDAIIIVSHGIIKYANPRMLDLCGELENGIINTPYYEYIHRDEIKKVAQRNIQRQSGNKTAPIYRSRLKRKNGEYIEVELSSSDIIFNDTDAELIIIRDLSDRENFGDTEPTK